MKVNILIATLLRPVLIALFLFPSSLVLANLGDTPGMIPLEYRKSPATDLVYEGRIILPDEAHELFVNSGGAFDLSLLNPDETSDLWKNQFPGKLDVSDDHIDYEVDQTPLYLGNIPSRSGNFRFTVQGQSTQGVMKAYTLMVSKNVHTVLLRKALLRKLGYRIPPIQHLKSMKLQFPNPMAQELFLSELSEATFGDPKRWVVSEDKEQNSVVLQDLIIFESHENSYNLAMGHVPQEVIQGRRILNSLIVAFALVDLNESANMLSWNLGRIVSNHVHIPYESAEEFNCSYEDARWMARRILHLSREDFEEIAQSAHLPPEVSALLTEKLISRRNSLRKVLNLEGEDLDFDPSLSMGEDLVEGKLTKENWEGYGSRFSFGDPESPLSPSEISAFVKSKLLSNVINNVVSNFNDKVLPHSQVENALLLRQEEIFRQQFIEYITTGKVTKVPLGIWAHPILGANIHAGREIVLGSYMGTDNQVQLADSIGLSADAGAFLSIEGLPTPWSVSAKVQGHINRIYTHLRPIKSMKKALKYPFKNLLVPLLQRKYGQIFDELRTQKFLSLEDGDEEKQKKITEVVGLFKEQLEIGESIIITDSLGAGLGVMPGFNFHQLLKLQASFAANQTVISRLHILRKDEDTVHIYKDLGNVTTLILSFHIRSAVPVLSLSTKFSRGTVKTKFYSLSLDDNLESNPKIVRVASALRNLFFYNSLESIGVLSKPYVLRHKFFENMNQAKLLFLKWDQLYSKVQIHATHPQGGSRDLYRRVYAERSGMDLVEWGTEALTGLLNQYADIDLGLMITGNGNPGDSVLGKAKTRAITIEGMLRDVQEEERVGYMDQPFVHYRETWKGWQLSRVSAKNLLKKIERRFKFPFYPDSVFNDTTKLQLYTINVNFFVYGPGLQHMGDLPAKEVEKIFYAHSHVKAGAWVLAKAFLHNQKKFRLYFKKGKVGLYTQYGIKMLDAATRNLTLPGITKLVGGEKNIYAFSTLHGFRKGDEQGDQPFYSHSLGEIGSRDMAGPGTSLLSRTGMTESEFYAYWMIGRLQ